MNNMNTLVDMKNVKTTFPIKCSPKEISKRIEIIGIFAKKLGRDENVISIFDKNIYDFVEQGCAITFQLRVGFGVPNYIRHITICFRENNSRTTTNKQKRTNIINTLRSIDISKINMNIVGFSTFGKGNNSFIIAITHFNSFQKQFQNIYSMGDQESPTPIKVAHISLCLGYDAKNNTITTRKNDEPTMEHIYWYHQMNSIHNFYPNSLDKFLIQKFNQNTNTNTNTNTIEIPQSSYILL